MRNKYAAPCIKCNRMVKPGQGDYVGWSEGVKDENGHRHGSGHYALCDACKVAVKSEPPAETR